MDVDPDGVRFWLGLVSLGGSWGSSEDMSGIGSRTPAHCDAQGRDRKIQEKKVMCIRSGGVVEMECVCVSYGQQMAVEWDGWGQRWLKRREGTV